MRISKIAAMTAVATALAVAVASGTASAAAPQALQNGPQGIDVSHYQGVIVWPTVALSGKRFVYIKATEGNAIQDEYFDLNYAQATLIGIIRGAYHFARPELSNGTVQADYFVDNGGGWSNDGRTLPGALDLEGDCAGKTPASMVQWIHQFADRYKQRTTRDVVIYTTRNWWNQCTGGNGGFAATNPLWHAEPDSSPQVPNGWTSYTFWQYGQGSVLGITGSVDLDVFNGSDDQLTRFVKGA